MTSRRSTACCASRCRLGGSAEPVPYGRLDDGFHAHPKRQRVTLAADGLLARAISYSSHYLTNGFVSEAWVRAQLPARRWRAVLESALSGPLLDHFAAGSTTTIVPVSRPGLVRIEVGPFTEDGYLIHDYLEDNLSAKEVSEQQERARARKNRHRSRVPLPGLDDADVTRDVTRDGRVLSRGTTPSHTTERPTP